MRPLLRRPGLAALMLAGRRRGGRVLAEVAGLARPRRKARSVAKRRQDGDHFQTKRVAATTNALERR